MRGVRGTAEGLLAAAAIRPDPRRDRLGGFVTLLLIMAGHALLETARDALFLARIAPARLPWVYLIIAAISLVLFGIDERRARRRPRRLGLSLWLLLSAGVTLLFWGIVHAERAWTLYALYAWAGVFATLVVVRFWTVIEGLFNITEAKPAFAFIGAGSVVGAIAGSALARGLTARLDASALLLAAAVVFALAAIGPLALSARPSGEGALAPPGRWPLADAARTVGSHPYLWRVAALVLSSTVALTFIDYIFKATAARSVPPERLGSFFAGVYLVLNLLSLVVQLLAVGWLLRSVALSRVLALMPVLLATGLGGVVAGVGLAAAVAVKVVDGSLRYSLHRTVTELLYVPLSEDLRARAKGFIDVLGQRGGQALASFAILATLAVGHDLRLAAYAALAFSALWIVVSLSLKRPYLDLFRRTLAEGAAPAPGGGALDLPGLESLMTALNSPDDAVVLAALDLLAEQGRTRLVPALILYHPSPAVVLRALELFAAARRRDFEPVASRLLARAEPALRAAILRALAASAQDPSRLKDWLEDPAPEVHATALVGLVAAGGALGERLAHGVVALADGGSAEARLALASAIRHQPAACFEEALLALARSDDPKVLAEVVKAMQAQPSPRFLPALLPLIARRELRRDTRRALVAIGREALQFLARALADRTLGASIRRHLPRTISRFEPAAAAAILLPRLLDEPDGAVRFKVLRALGRLRADRPELVLDEALLQRAAERALTAAYRALGYRLALERGAAEDPERRTAVHELLRDLLADKEALALERFFRVLSLLDPEEDYQRIHRGLRSSAAETRAGSRELLQHLLAPSLRGPALGLIEEVPDAERMERGGIHRPRAGTYEEVLAELLERASPPLRSLAAYHVGELGIEQLRPRLESARRDDHGFVREAIERALARLGPPGGELAPAGGAP